MEKRVLAIGVGTNGEIAARQIFNSIRSPENEPGFDLKLLVNPSIENITQEIRTFLSKIDGFTLIYYAGRTRGNSSIVGQEGINLPKDEEKFHGQDKFSLDKTSLLDLVQTQTRSAAALLIFEIEDAFHQNEKTITVEEIEPGRLLTVIVNHFNQEPGTKLSQLLTGTTAKKNIPIKLFDFACNHDAKNRLKFAPLQTINNFEANFTPNLSDPKIGSGDFMGITTIDKSALLNQVERDTPYPALQSFGLGEQKYFYGREKEIAAVVDLLKTTVVLNLKGQTGDGKSSLLKAGIIPELVNNHNYFAIFINKYGKDPFKDLLSSLSNWINTSGITRFNQLLAELQNRIPEQKIVLILDQFERGLFTPNANFNNFINQIYEAAKKNHQNFRVIFATREEANTPEHLNQLPNLFDKPQNYLTVPPLKDDDILAAILNPLRHHQNLIKNRPNNEEVDNISIDEDFVRNTLMPQIQDFYRQLSPFKNEENTIEISPVYLQIICETLYSTARDFVYKEINADLCTYYTTFEKTPKLDNPTKPPEQNIIKIILTNYLTTKIATLFRKEDQEFIHNVLYFLVGQSGDFAYAKDKSLSKVERKFDKRRNFLTNALERLEEARLIQRFTEDGEEYVKLSHDFIASTIALTPAFQDKQKNSKKQLQKDLEEAKTQTKTLQEENVIFQEIIKEDSNKASAKIIALNSKIIELNSQIETLENQTTKQISYLNQEIKKNSEQLNENKTTIKSLQNSKNKMAKQIEAQKNELHKSKQELLIREEAIQKLQQQISHLEEKSAQLTSENITIKSVKETLKNELNKSKQELLIREEAIQKLQQQISHLEEKLAQITSENVTIKSEKKAKSQNTPSAVTPLWTDEDFANLEKDNATFKKLIEILQSENETVKAPQNTKNLTKAINRAIQAKEKAENESIQAKKQLEQQRKTHSLAIIHEQKYLRLKKIVSRIRNLIFAGAVGTSIIWIGNESIKNYRIKKNLEDGSNQQAEGDAQSALKSYKTVIELEPENYTAWQQTAIIQAQEGLFEEAIESCEKSTALNPEKGNICLQIAQISEKDQKNKKATTKAYEKALELSPENHKIYGHYLNFLYNTDQKDLAEKILQKAIQQNFIDPKAYKEIALLFTGRQQNQNLEAAIQLYVAAAKKTPDKESKARIFQNISTFYGKLNQDSSAIEYKQKAAEADPTNPHHQMDLAIYFKQSQKLHEAIFHYRKAIEIDPTKSYLFNHLAEALYEIKNYSEALEAIQKSINLNPSNPSLHFQRGLILTELQSFPECIKSYDKVIELYLIKLNGNNSPLIIKNINSNISKAWNNKGVCFNRLGQKEASQQAFREALKIDPTNETAKKNIE